MNSKYPVTVHFDSREDASWFIGEMQNIARLRKKAFDEKPGGRRVQLLIESLWRSKGIACPITLAPSGACLQRGGATQFLVDGYDRRLPWAATDDEFNVIYEAATRAEIPKDDRICVIRDRSKVQNTSPVKQNV